MSRIYNDYYRDTKGLYTNHSISIEDLLRDALDRNDNDLFLYIVSHEEFKVNEKMGLMECTPLHYAANSGNVFGIRELIRRGADTEVTDCNGMTPIFYASLWGEVNAISVL